MPCTIQEILTRLAYELAGRLPMWEAERVFNNVAHDIAAGDRPIPLHILPWAEAATAQLRLHAPPPDQTLTLIENTLAIYEAEGSGIIEKIKWLGFKLHEGGFYETHDDVIGAERDAGRASGLREAALTVRKLGSDSSVMSERGVPHASAYFIDPEKLAAAIEALAEPPEVGDRVRVTVKSPDSLSPAVGTEGILREINDSPDSPYRYLVGGPDQPDPSHIGWATDVVVVARAQKEPTTE